MIKFLLSIGILVLLVAGFAVYMGALRTVRIAESEEGPFFFVYREVPGQDQGAIGRVTTELHDKLTVANVKNFKPFDVFYPAESKRASEIGFVVNESDVSMMQAQDKSVFYRVVQRQRFMTCMFPFKNRASFIIGYIKVNPALEEHRKAHSYLPAPGMMRNDGDYITYLQPIRTRSASTHD